MSDSHVASEASRALHSIVVLWMILISAGSVDPAAAADAPTPSDSAEADSGGLEEVVVTAQKRRQNLQDVGISITALSGSDMKDMGLTEPVSIAQQTPGLSFSSIHQGNATFNIRGVSQNDFADHFEPPVALYIDEAYVPHQAVGRAAVFDVDRIEVLRGPQGTLFGRNATGGLVHLLSRQPTGNFESYVDVTGGDYGLIGAESAVSGPITDSFRFRIAGVYNHSDGWFKNRTGKDLDDQNNYGGRLILDWSVAPETTANLKLHVSRTPRESGQGFDQTPTVLNAEGLGRALGANEVGTWPNIVTGGVVVGRCPGCDIEGYKEPDRDPRTGSVSYGDFHRTIAGSTLKLTSKIGGVGVTAITDYLRVKKFLDGDPDAAPQTFFRYVTSQSSKDFSQELRFDGATQSSRWQAGAYYLNMSSDYMSLVDLDIAPYLNLPNGAVILTTETTYTLDVRSYAAFGQVEYDLRPDLTAIAGLRYTSDHKKIDALFDDSQFTGNPATPFNPSLYPDLARKRFNNVSARLELDWRPIDGVMLYSSVNRGHKGGNWAMPVFGMNPDPALRATLNFPTLPHDQEVLTSYEIGEKATFWNGRAKLNSSLYYYDYHNYQVFSLRDAVQELFNRDAKISGAEAEFTWTPTEGLFMQLGSALMWERKVEDVPLPTGPADRQMPLSPKVTANALVRYSWHAGSGKIAAQVNGRWTDGFYFYAANEPVTRQDAYSTVDARLSYLTGDGHWEFALWGKNLADTDYYNFRLDVGSLSYCGCGIAAPRTIGGTVSWRMD